MENFVLNVIFIVIFVILTAVFLYMMFDYGSFITKFKDDSSAEKNLLKEIKKTHQEHIIMKDKLKQAIAKNEELIAKLNIADADVKKKIEEIKLRRLDTLSTFDNQIVENDKEIAQLDNYRTTLNNKVNTVSICSASKMLKQHNDKILQSIDNIKKDTLDIWNSLKQAETDNIVVFKRSDRSAAKILQHEQAVQQLLQHNIVIKDSISQFQNVLKSKSNYAKQMYNIVKENDIEINLFKTDQDDLSTNISLLKEKYVENQNDIDFIENEKYRLVTDIKELDERVDLLTSAMTHESYVNKDLNVAEFQEQILSFRQLLDTYDMTIKELQDKNVILQSDVKKLEKRMELIKKDITNLNNDVNDINTNLSTYSDQNISLLGNLDGLDNENATLNGNITNVQSILTNNEEIVTNIDNLDSDIRTNIQNNFYQEDGFMLLNKFTDNLSHFFGFDNSSYKLFNYSGTAPNIQLKTAAVAKNGLTVQTSGQNLNEENFRICDNQNKCMNMSVNNNGFYITPENIDNLSIYPPSQPVIEGFSQNLSQGLYVWYKFNNNFTDSSGNENNATPFNNPTFSTDRKEGSHSVSFAGGTVQNQSIAQYLTVPRTDFSQWNGFSVSCWVYFTKQDNNWERIFDFGDGENNNNIVLCRFGLTNNIYFGIRNGSAESYIVFKNAIENNQWMHIAVSVTKSPITYSVYKNGVLQVPSGISDNPRWPSSTTYNNCYIAKSNWHQHDVNFKGKMDDFRIYNRAITATEVTELYNSYLTLPGVGIQPVTPPSAEIIGANGTYPFARFDLKDEAIYLGGSDNNAAAIIKNKKVYMKEFNINNAHIYKNI